MVAAEDVRRTFPKPAGSGREVTYVSWTLTLSPDTPCSRYMSDIPLRTFGRSRNSRSGYAPLNTEQDGYDANGNVNENNQTMPVQTVVTKAAVANHNRKRWKGKKKQTYQDDPEEHEGLLGDDQDHDSEDEVGRAGPARPTAQEARPTSHIALLHLISSSDRFLGRALAEEMQAAQKTSPELYRFDPQVCFDDNAVGPAPPKLICVPPRQVSITVHPEYRQKPEIQRVHFLAHRVLRAVQVFLQLVFLAGSPFAVRTRAEDRFVVLLPFLLATNYSRLTSQDSLRHTSRLSRSSSS